MAEVNPKIRTMECAICCQAFTGVKRKSVSCAYCAYPACLECIQKFLLDTSTGYDPKCMNCDKPWTQEFVDDILPKSFRNGPLKKRRQDVLWEREKSMLPGSTALVDRELTLRKEKEMLKTHIEHRKNLMSELAELGYIIRDTTIKIDTLQNLQVDIERRQFVRPCPGDDCRGYLSTQWKCGLCDIQVCSECHDIKAGSDEHVCNPDNLASAQALRRETRPCPTCGARIYKIDGCDQMYCTVESCHTAFSWSTGRIETGHIHNPHYYDWLRKNNNGFVPREPGDNPCQNQNFVDIYALREYFRSNPSLVMLDYDKYHRAAVHIRFHEIPLNNQTAPRHHLARNYLPRNQDNPETKNADLRVKYLLKEIDEPSFKKEIFRRQKNGEVITARHNLMQMYVDVSGDLFRSILASKDQERLNEIIKEFKTLRKYFNQQSEAISKRFNLSVFKRIRSTWTMDTSTVKKTTIDLTSPGPSSS